MAVAAVRNDCGGSRGGRNNIHQCEALHLPVPALQGIGTATEALEGLTARASAA
ncbi:hypothetical protein ACFQX4_11225 [Roseomonas sp. GCM10028921]